MSVEEAEWEEDVPLSLIHKLEDTREGDSTKADVDALLEEVLGDDGIPLTEVPKEIQFIVGDRVEARYRGRAKKFYKGTIVAITDEKYSIDYDDGDKDKSLSAEFIRMTSKPRPEIAVEQREPTPKKEVESVQDVEVTNDVMEYVKGDRVEGRYRGKDRRWYLGTIAECRPDGMYDVHYDDGDKDFNLSSEFIRKVGLLLAETPPLTKLDVAPKELSSKSPMVTSNGGSSVDNFNEESSAKSTEGALKKGDRVEAKFRGRGTRWFKGTVSSRLPNGTYNVTYDSGDSDLRLPSTAWTKDYSSQHPQFAEGAEVKVESGTIRKARLSGEKEIAAVPELIRLQKRVSFVMDEEEEAAKKIAVQQSTTDEPKEMTNDVLIEAEMDRTFKCIIEEEHDEVVTALVREVNADVLDVKESLLTPTTISGKGNKLYRGVVTKVKVITLYEVTYPDNTKDVNIPFEALHVHEGVASSSDVQVGSAVDVLSWQDRFPTY
ncbi:predicted protein [Thalassiosira pseudonana CCMP1335]|uniref:Tudor domain-containing protein n=1 Tax=Thalassiosira pseudonana TaxID=35128 RepID=B8BX66_THAPS|nr:predicted protein [Thalassiosira pseudonana CCMP1335]EED93655.1 predicted protein [Thalassiosira pseudonana CCMP1335]